MRTSTSGQGRRKGIPNKATSEAKRAIGMFVDANSHRLQQWLDMVANGIVLMDDKGEPILSKTGAIQYAVEPDPGKAFDLFQKVIEYHVPKLNRSEVTGVDGGPLEVDADVNINVNFVKPRGVDA